MKAKIILVLFLCLNVILTLAQKTEPVKHALIIAIGDYPTNESGWGKISSENDVAIIKNALEHQKFSEITVIKDQQADREGILKALEQFTLSLNPGDIALIHISSHGQQIQDNNGDEIDGLDEAIVAYGAPMNSKYFENTGIANYRGEKHLRDEDFGTHMMNIRKMLGQKGDLLVIIDACHSGTGTRGTALVRGGAPPLTEEGFVKPETTNNKEVFLFEEQISDKLAHYVVISGARASELNYEVEEDNVGYGSLSYAVSKALISCNGNITYRGLFATVADIMYNKVPKQTPTIEGDIDRELFGGKAVVQTPYLQIKEIVSARELKLNGGKIAGIYDSAKIAVYPKGTLNPDGKSMLATGYITKSDNLYSDVVLDKALNIKNITEAWVFVTSRTFPDIRVKVGMGKFENSELAANVKQKLSNNPVVILTDANDAELVVKEPSARGTVVNLLYSVDSSEYNSNIELEKLDQKIMNFAQTKFVRDMDIGSNDFNISMEFVPLRKNTDGSVDTLALSDFMVNGIPELPKGIYCAIKIKNHGKKPCYFSIIDIQPDGVISPIVPNAKCKLGPDDYLIDTGKVFVTPFTVKMAPPYGKELYKVFASDEPIDMSFTVTTRGEQRPNEQSIEKLFRKTYDPGSMAGKRGTEVDDINSGSFGTRDYPFIIKEK